MSSKKKSGPWPAKWRPKRRYSITELESMMRHRRAYVEATRGKIHEIEKKMKSRGLSSEEWWGCLRKVRKLEQEIRSVYGSKPKWLEQYRERADEIANQATLAELWGEPG